MKILLINTSEKTGGAAVACGRLMKALQKENLDVKMLVRDKETESDDVISLNVANSSKFLNKIYFFWERFFIFVNNRFSRKNLFAVSIANCGAQISTHPAVLEADIIHLHWINQGFLSLQEIDKLSKLGKPIVWTMHDMWAATGICHHSRDCDHYQTECKSCFFLPNANEHDLAFQVFREKKKIWKHAAIEFVTCSEWLKERTKLSALIDSTHVQSIPNPIDIEFYRPSDKAKARTRFNLPPHKKLLLYGAANVTDKRKGIDYYIEACRILTDNYSETSKEIELVFLGKTKENIDFLFPFPIHQIGYLNDNEAIRDLYCAVDLFVTPSLEENLPNTIMESLACGTPAVGFSVGGIPEMIDHKKNGFLAEYKSSESLAEGINWCIWEADQQELSQYARQKVVDCYAETIIAKEYIHLYSQLLSQNQK
jgi:glycosyltransferase involved in cell wall biosynthesis